MKGFATFLVLTCISIALTAASDAECTVRLLNGDRVQGTYRGQDRAFVLLQTGTPNGLLRIHGKYIETLDFGKKDGAARADYEMQFSPGQDLRGKELKFVDGSMQFQTSWGETLILDRGYIQKIKTAHSEDRVIFRGPGPPEKWTGEMTRKPSPRNVTKFPPDPAGEWVLEGTGTLSTNFPLLNQGIALQLELNIPESAGGDAFKIIVEGLPGMAGDHKDRSGFIQIVLSPLSLTVEEFQAMEVRRVLLGERKVVRGSMPRPAAGRFHLLMEYDVENRRYRVKAGDQVISEWASEPPLPASNGYSPRLRIEWNLQSESMTLREVLLTLRDRPLPGKSVKIPEEEETVVFENGDALKAQWKGLDDKGNWILELPGLASRTPIEPSRIQMWLNGGNDLKQIRRLAGHVEVILAGGEERFIAELVDADENAFTFKREGWTGLTRVPVSRVEEVNFNPYY